MKAKLVKKIVCGITSSMLLFSVCSLPAQAASIPEEPPVTIQADGGEITPRADQIVVKTRFYNGKQQYRRWNATQNCWVDPYWIDM